MEERAVDAQVPPVEGRAPDDPAHDVAAAVAVGQGAVGDHHTDPFNTAFFDIAQEVTP